MSEQTSDYLWSPLAEDVAGGYALDPLGEWVLDALVVYAPSTAKLRTVGLRNLERTATTDPYGIMQRDPPTAAQVEAAWAKQQQQAPLGRADSRLAQKRWDAEALNPDELRRRPGEAVDDFYMRVARAYHALRRSGTRLPLIDALADAAGVPPGTAASWVSRAKARGLIGEDEEQ